MVGFYYRSHRKAIQILHTFFHSNYPLIRTTPGGGGLTFNIECSG